MREKGERGERREKELVSSLAKSGGTKRKGGERRLEGRDDGRSVTREWVERESIEEGGETRRWSYAQLFLVEQPREGCSSAVASRKLPRLLDVRKKILLRIFHLDG